MSFYIRYSALNTVNIENLLGTIVSGATTGIAVPVTATGTDSITTYVTGDNKIFSTLNIDDVSSPVPGYIKITNEITPYGLFSTAPSVAVAIGNTDSIDLSTNGSGEIVGDLRLDQTSTVSSDIVVITNEITSNGLFSTFSLTGTGSITLFSTGTDSIGGNLNLDITTLPTIGSVKIDNTISQNGLFSTLGITGSSSIFLYSTGSFLSSNLILDEVSTAPEGRVKVTNSITNTGLFSTLSITGSSSILLFSTGSSLSSNLILNTGSIAPAGSVKVTNSITNTGLFSTLSITGSASILLFSTGSSLSSNLIVDDVSIAPEGSVKIANSITNTGLFSTLAITGSASILLFSTGSSLSSNLIIDDVSIAPEGSVKIANSITNTGLFSTLAITGSNSILLFSTGSSLSSNLIVDDVSIAPEGSVKVTNSITNTGLFSTLAITGSASILLFSTGSSLSSSLIIDDLSVAPLGSVKVANTIGNTGLFSTFAITSSNSIFLFSTGSSLSSSLVLDNVSNAPPNFVKISNVITNTGLLSTLGVTGSSSIFIFSTGSLLSSNLILDNVSTGTPGNIKVDSVITQYGLFSTVPEINIKSQLSSASSPYLEYFPVTGVFVLNTGTVQGTVAVGNDPRFVTKNLLLVKNSDPGYGEFSSIAAAVNTILDSSVSNPYAVKVGPGIYMEPEITLPPYVQLVGESIYSTVVQPDGPHNIINLSNLTEVSFMTLQNCQTGFYAINATDVGDFAQIHKISIFNCIDCINVTSVTSDSLMYIEYAEIWGEYTHGIVVQPSNGFQAFCNTENFYAYPSSITNHSQVYATGTNYKLAMSLFTFFGESYGNGIICSGTGTCSIEDFRMDNFVVAFLASDGTECDLSNGILSQSNFGILTLSGYSSHPNITVFSTDFDNCTTDIQFDDLSTSGSLSGDVNLSKCFINSTTPFTIQGRGLYDIKVFKNGGDFSTISAALDYISPTKTCALNSTTTITSINLFNPAMNGTLVTGSGIVPGTVATYVNSNTITLSVAATATMSSNVQFFKASNTNRVTIYVGAGSFVETTPLHIVSYITISGLARQTVVSSISPTTDVPVFIPHQLSAISNIAINADIGIGILVDSNGATSALNATVMTSVFFYQSMIGLKMMSTTAINQGVLRSSNFISCNTSILGNGTTAQSVAQNTLITDTIFMQPTAANSIGVDVQGPNMYILLSTVEILLTGVTDGMGLYVADGVDFNGNNIFISGHTVGLNVPNIGDGPDFSLNNLTLLNTVTQDISIENSNTTGVIVGIAQKSATFIDPQASLTINLTDPVVNGTIIPGTLYCGTGYNTVVDMVPAFQAGVIGIISGGNLSKGTDPTLDLLISAGNGYAKSTFTNALSQCIWGDRVFTMSPNTTSYIYFTPTGFTGAALVSSSSLPNPTTAILLGRAIAGSSTIEIIDKSPVISNQIENKIDSYNRVVFGAIFSRGSIVTTPATGLTFTVSSGQFYLSELVFNPSGKPTGTNFYPYYRDSETTFVRMSGTTSLDNLQYNNITTNSLVMMTDTYYTKHSIYLVGQGADEQYLDVYGQAQYANLGDAQAAPLALPPTNFTDGIVIIASIIVQKDATSIPSIQIASQRPIPSFNASAISGSVYHGSLLGLLDDDHPQYLLVNGTRAMASNLNMGGNSIINVGLVGGVDVAAHASRHLPLGDDPIYTTGALFPLSATTTNDSGTANSLTRSDHSHSILTGSPVQQQSDQPNATGTAATLARSDHVHYIQTDIAVSVSTVNSTGVLFTFAKSDHTHQGVHSILDSSAVNHYGDITLQSGTGVVVRTDGNTFSFDISLTGTYSSITVGELNCGTGIFDVVISNSGVFTTLIANSGIFSTINSSDIYSNSGVFTTLLANTEIVETANVSAFTGNTGSFNSLNIPSLTGFYQIADIPALSVEPRDIVPVFEGLTTTAATTTIPSVYNVTRYRIPSACTVSTLRFAVPTLPGTNIAVGIYQRPGGASGNASFPVPVVATGIFTGLTVAIINIPLSPASLRLSPGYIYVAYGRTLAGGANTTFQCYTNNAATVLTTAGISSLSLATTIDSLTTSLPATITFGAGYVAGTIQPIIRLVS